ncbi:MAG TPA: hypothetical protein VHN79_11310 [Lacunisphaera sp.]|nr:hypothetical protein [Lacunisphaera sp.]
MKKFSLLFIGLAAACVFLSAQAEDAATVPAASLPEVNHLVHLSELPSTEDLMASAKANGLEVVRVDRTAGRVVVTYRYASGATGTVGYALLSEANKSERVVARVQPRSSTVYTQTETRVIEPRDPEIIYVEREPRTRVIYRERDDFWVPLTVGLGLGYITGHHGHGHHGHHNHWRGHRGHHRAHWSVHGRWHR